MADPLAIIKDTVTRVLEGAAFLFTDEIAPEMMPVQGSAWDALGVGIEYHGPHSGQVRLWVPYALAKANIKIDSTTLSVTVSSVIAAAAGTVFKLAGAWLEAHKGSWWGKLFLIAKAPAYSNAPAPQPAPVVVPTIPVQTTPPGA